MKNSLRSHRADLLTRRPADATLLAVDVGNTQITLGVYRGETLLRTWRLRSYPRVTADELGIQLAGLLQFGLPGGVSLNGAIIASVVPALEAPLQEAITRYLHLDPLLVTPSTDLGIRNRYKKPEEVGADRLVDAVAAHHLYPGKAVIVVDFGTATTFDCISSAGDYLGGAICAGLEHAGDWLATHTAKLPRVTLHSAPEHVLGRTTKESLQSGLFWGYIALVEGLLERLSKEMRSKPVVVATGGLSPVIGPHVPGLARVMPELTLFGLRLIWERITR